MTPAIPPIPPVVVPYSHGCWDLRTRLAAPLALCNTTAGSGVDTTWTCGGVLMMGTFNLRLGVVTDTVCHRIGANSATTAGFWDYEVSSGGARVAVCCQ
jgi:hypothetical protein